MRAFLRTTNATQKRVKKANLSTKINRSMKGSGRMIKNMEMVFTNGLMDLLLLVLGKTVSREKALLKRKMVKVSALLKTLMIESINNI